MWMSLWREKCQLRIQKNGDLEEQKSDEKNTLKPVQHTSKIEIHLTDKETKEEMQGIQFEIYEAKASNVEATNKTEEKQTDEKKEQANNAEANNIEPTKEVGQKIDEFTIEENGYYKEKLPIGEYILKQKEGQEEQLQEKGYAKLSDKTIIVKDTKELQIINLEQNYTKLEIEIIDKTSKTIIPGIKLEIYEIITKEDGTKEIGEKLREVTTQEGQTIVERLPVGEYILKEVEGQKEILYDKGYITNEKVEIKVEDKEEIQKITVEQQESRLEIDLKDEDKTVPGTTIQIIDKETGEVVEEFTTDEGDKKIIDKLPLGDYIIHIKDVPHEEGYVKGDDIEISIKDDTKPQEIHLKQDYTKVEVSLLDIDTKEPVIGGTLVIVNKEGKEMSERWVTNGKPHRIDKLPIGEYELVEKEAPTLKGYVRTEKVAFTVKETGEIQYVEMLQDYTRIELKPTDKDTGEEIKDIELVIKDDKGNEVGKVTIGKDEDTNHILERLPVGDYIIESTKVPYGYKPIHTQISIKDKQGLQGGDELKITIEKEEFDLNVEAIVQQIKRNDKAEYAAKTDSKENKENQANQKRQAHKVDIKDKKIGTEQIEVTYKIKVRNQKKITGQVGRVEVSIPAGMTFKASNNKTYWKEENGKVVTEGLKGRDLKSGDYAEIPLVLNWKNGLENFGTKKIEVEIKEVTSDIGFKETNLENNKAVSEEIIIGVSTGEMNLVYMCWILLAVLILAEIYLSKKTKIKKFAIKDKTTKWRQ